MNQNKDQGKIKVGISIGDPNGVGVEIILKIFESKNSFNFFTPFVFSPYQILINQKKYFNFSTDLNLVSKQVSPVEGKLNIIQTTDDEGQMGFGEASKISGGIALKSFLDATKVLKKGEIDILVTAPFDKSTIQTKEYKFSGHTEYLNQELEGESMMLMVSGKLKIALMSEHVPIREISKRLSRKGLIKKISKLKNTLKLDFGIINPKIAVLGINPHAGDNGLIGEEEKMIIKPVIKELISKGETVYGPFSADGFFGSQKHLHFDAILAMYHDQGLIPFKTLSFGNGVNFTAGLDKIRTSPDHGTAYEIAGKGIAKTNSFKQALLLGRKIYLFRKARRKNLIFR